MPGLFHPDAPSWRGRGTGRAGGHNGHNSLPSRTHQHGCTGIPVGVTFTGKESGECDANRNAPLATDRPQHLSGQASRLDHLMGNYPRLCNISDG